MAQVETSSVIGFQLGVGEHKLRFSPKEQYKDELSLRSLTLPVVNLKGEVSRKHRTKTPQVAIELAVKVINIDLTTGVLNQLLILQNTFIKVRKTTFPCATFKCIDVYVHVHVYKQPK